MNSLFSNEVNRPLADRLRPKKIEEVVGQSHLTGEGQPLKRMLDSKNITSFILWGPAGCGKTTIAKLIADYTDNYFEQISAIFSGVADLKKVFESAKLRRDMHGRGTVLFVDEIHRFNKSQQDGFLPYVEDGTIILIGATTENPSFELNSALLSRAQVFTLNRLDSDGFEKLIERAELEEDKKLPLDDDARIALKNIADGDGRYFLNMVESIYNLVQEDEVVDCDKLFEMVKRRKPIYDKGRDGHYNLASAMQKSIRGSDVDAALYWVARMVDAGEDPKFIFRRLTIIATEDVALADPNAVNIAMNCWQVFERVGMPEARLALSQLVIYLATAPKSNSSYMAWAKAMELAQQTGSLMPPNHILNAPTKMMGDLGYGEDYQYDHDAEDGFSGQDFFPDEMGRTMIYRPIERGFERDIAKRYKYYENLRLSRKITSNSATTKKSK